MKNPFDNLDRVLEHRVRLQIMSVLVTDDALDFNSLKDLLHEGTINRREENLRKENRGNG